MNRRRHSGLLRRRGCRSTIRFSVTSRRAHASETQTLGKLSLHLSGTRKSFAKACRGSFFVGVSVAYWFSPFAYKDNPGSVLYSRPEWRLEIQQDVSESYVLHIVPEKAHYSVERVRQDEIATMDLQGQCYV
jgi:hypothetical protein